MKKIAGNKMNGSRVKTDKIALIFTKERVG